MSSKTQKITPIDCVIAASFTIEPIQRSLDLLLDKLALPLKSVIAPYHQVFQQLVDPTSEVSKNEGGINLFVLRLEDFVRDISDQEKLDKLAQFTQDLMTSFEQYAQRASAASVVLMLPPSPDLQAGLSAGVAEQTGLMSQQLSKLNGVTILSQEAVVTAGFDQSVYYDALSNELGHVPFNELGYAKLSLIAARLLHTLKVTAKKVLVLDCDNTIWKGVVGEDGVDGIGLTDGFLAVQQFAVDLQKQGVLIALASKNVEQDVMEVFEKRDDMILKLEHIVSHRVNWEPKAANLQSLADELNLGIDSFVFLDDNPVECGQMHELQPLVTTLQLPQESEIPALIDQMWMFDKLSVTEEDAKRTQMYRENSARQKLESSATDMTKFLASLELKIICEPPQEAEWPRVAQLTNRTNQFNFTTVRRNESEVRALAAQDGGFVLKVDVSDRFGDYGLVGDMFAVKQEDVLLIDTFLLSCRVLGRGVEYEMLRSLGRLAIEQGCQFVKLPYITTVKNEPARAFADSVIANYKEGDENEGHYLVPSDVMQNIVYVAGTEPEAVKAAKAGKSKKTKKNTGSAAQAISERYGFLSTLSSPQALIDVMIVENAKTRTLPHPPISAETVEEQRMLDLWQKVLEIKDLGMEDDYFQLGGTSLMAARLFAEITREFGQQMRLTTIMDAPTPRQLLNYMQSSAGESKRGLIKLKAATDTRKLFLVHDGDGETLLYMNLANHLPNDVSVYGIEPDAQPDIPMAYDSIESMSDHYISIMQEAQPEGPYYLGGMCAGGLIAHVIASRLQKLGHEVAGVVMLDTATPGANRVFAKIAKDRAGRMQALFDEVGASNQNFIQKSFALAGGVLGKVFNTLRWEMQNKWQEAYRKYRFKQLVKVVKAASHWPSYLKPMTIREIYNSAEEVCQLPQSNVPTYLVKATVGSGDDIPFKEVYSDHDFGWSQYANVLTVVDTEGGHASMLQEPNAKNLSDIVSNVMKVD